MPDIVRIEVPDSLVPGQRLLVSRLCLQRQSLGAERVLMIELEIQVSPGGVDCLFRADRGSRRMGLHRISIDFERTLGCLEGTRAGEGLVLDGGTGSGRASLMVLRERPGAPVLAVDLYEGYFGIADNTPQRLLDNVARAGVEGRVEARAGDLTDLQLEDASVDAALSAYVIDHLSREDVERSLAEIERVLRPSGDFLLMVINPDKRTRIAYPFFVHHGYFGGRSRHEGWRSRLGQAGFAVVELGTTPGTLYLLSRRGAGTNPPESGG